MQRRRIISKEIVGSDAFLSMPISAQTLYFHLIMNADNRGYINNARSLISMFDEIHLEDLEELTKSKFVLKRGNGLYLIKHWYIHNDIPTYINEETNYIDDLQKLCFDENFAYTERCTDIKVVDTIKKRKPFKENKNKSKENQNQNENEIKNKLKVNENESSKLVSNKDIPIEELDDNKPF